MKKAASTSSYEKEKKEKERTSHLVKFDFVGKQKVDGKLKLMLIKWVLFLSAPY